MISYIFLLLAITSMAYADGQNWAVLVAGSNGYYNYRHQADVCHSYQILHRNGIPDERIIVMMYDDIANSESNPFKGTIINRPGGEDVYKGTPKDYTGADVTPENFLNVLKGVSNKDGKKVLQSGPDDNVFVYFADHGAPGLIAFPDGPVLKYKQLNDAIKYMHDNKMFKNLVFYLEACESGSMFNGHLPNDINVFATTAANSDESSYACYYDDARGTYLGDLYSVNWMEDSDKQNIWQETLDKQFKIVKKLTTESHCEEFGNLSISTSMVIGDFQGEKSSNIKASPLNYETPSKSDAIRTDDASISIVRKQLVKATGEKKAKLNSELIKLLNMKERAINVIRKIALKTLNNRVSMYSYLIAEKKPRLTQQNGDCYLQTVDRLFEKCFDSRNEFVLRNLYVLLNMCQSQLSTESIISAIDKVCIKRFD